MSVMAVADVCTVCVCVSMRTDPAAGVVKSLSESASDSRR